MPIPTLEPTEEEVIQQKQDQEERRKKATEDIMASEVFKSLDLPEDKQEETPKKSVKKSEAEDESDEDEDEVALEDEEESEEAEESDEESEEEDEEEEVIPKSKIQKRINKLTAQIKAQQDEIAQLKAKAEPKDDLSRKLETMSEGELKTLRRQARSEQLKLAREGSSEEDISKYMELEERIDDMLRSAPQKFINDQVAAFNKKAEEIALEAQDEGIDLKPLVNKIKALASEIYNDAPELQKSKHGQARALDLAWKHHKAIAGLSKGKSGDSRLKSQVNSLKRKVTLDTKSARGNADKERVAKLREKAFGGTMRDKISLVRNDPRFGIDAMIPDEFKE